MHRVEKRSARVCALVYPVTALYFIFPPRVEHLYVSLSHSHSLSLSLSLSLSRSLSFSLTHSQGRNWDGSLCVGMCVSYELEMLCKRKRVCNCGPVYYTQRKCKRKVSERKKNRGEWRRQEKYIHIRVKDCHSGDSRDLMVEFCQSKDWGNAESESAQTSSDLEYMLMVASSESHTLKAGPKEEREREKERERERESMRMLLEKGAASEKGYFSLASTWLVTGQTSTW